MNANNSQKSSIDRLARENNFQIKHCIPLPGGDSNQVFLVTTGSEEKFVVKLNSSDRFPGMFPAEKAGLEILKTSRTIDVPKVIDVGAFDNQAYLLLEYKASAKPTAGFWGDFGKALAGLHRNTAPNFGLSHTNYIGSLPQQNNFCGAPAEFYITQRIEPQLKLARDNRYHLEVSGQFFKNISELIPREPPSLIHGDLWKGNYLVNSAGFPCLIDPAIAYAPRELDLAMMKLFGGFDSQLYASYHEEFPLAPGFEERVPLWQLYYLLVHLNLFGPGYKSAVEDIIRGFS